MSLEFLVASLDRHPIAVRGLLSDFSVYDQSELEQQIEVIKMRGSYKAKPFLKWVGGKGRFVKKFHDFYPKEGVQFDSTKNTYFEPFLGGGAIFFDLQPQKAVISDLNPELIATYKVVQKNPKKLIKLLKEHKIKDSKDYYYDTRSIDTKALGAVEKAARFIYLNRTCFNGIHRVNRKGEFNVPYAHYKDPKICDEENIWNAHEALKGKTIRCGGYEKVLKHAVKGDFVYLDSPYYPMCKRTANFTKYTKDCFNDEDHIKVRDMFVELTDRGCFVMLSNSDVPFIRSIYKDCLKVRFDEIYGRRFVASKGISRKKVGELLIRNYV